MVNNNWIKAIQTFRRETGGVGLALAPRRGTIEYEKIIKIKERLDKQGTTNSIQRSSRRSSRKGSKKTSRRASRKGSRKGSRKTSRK